MTDGAKRWYVVHTYTGHENKAKTNIEQRIDSMGVADDVFTVFIPTEQFVEMKGGKRTTSERRIFPGYVLVEMIMTPNAWFAVRNTPGVTGFVGTTTAGREDPIPLTDAEVAKIVRATGVETPKVKARFASGDAIRVVDGPFADFVGKVYAVYAERNKLSVHIEMFGRETPVELDFLQVDPL